jgi:hypothetical protein
VLLSGQRLATARISKSQMDAQRLEATSSRIIGAAFGKENSR